MEENPECRVLNTRTMIRCCCLKRCVLHTVFQFSDLHCNILLPKNLFEITTIYLVDISLKFIVTKFVLKQI